MPSLVVAASLTLSLALAGAAPDAGPLPAGAADRRLTLQLLDADVTNVYRLLAGAGGMNVVVDECVAHQRISLTLKNAPLSMILGLMAKRLGTAYTVDDAGLHVGCGGLRDPLAGMPPAFQRKITVELRDGAADKVYGLFSSMTKTPFHIDDCVKDKRVDIKLKNVPVEIVLEAIDSSIGVVHGFDQDGGVTVRCAE